MTEGCAWTQGSQVILDAQMSRGACVGPPLGP